MVRVHDDFCILYLHSSTLKVFFKLFYLLTNQVCGIKKLVIMKERLLLFIK